MNTWNVFHNRIKLLLKVDCALEARMKIFLIAHCFLIFFKRRGKQSLFCVYFALNDGGNACRNIFFLIQIRHFIWFRCLKLVELALALSLVLRLCLLTRKFLSIHLSLIVVLTTPKLLKNTSLYFNTWRFVFKRVNIKIKSIIFERILNCILISGKILKRIFNVL